MPKSYMSNGSIDYIENGQRQSSAKSPLESMGYCLACGARLSFCGSPFTADIRCRKCGAVNVYEESQQPKRLAT